MPVRLVWFVVLATFLPSPAWSTNTRSSPLDLPVASMMVVVPDTYAAATALAAGGGSPVDIALGVVGAFEGRTQHVIQTNDRSEAPSSALVTVVRDGLLDDAVRGERWEISLDRMSTGVWTIGSVLKAWRCRRGGGPDAFAASPCP